MLSSTTAERFGGIARLYGVSALEKFQASHICIVGVGGVGSWTAEALARSGIGAITMIDLDEICVSNINRQLHAMDGQIGRQKSAAMAERIAAINPECKTHCHQAFYAPKNAKNLLSEPFDCVIDAIDQVHAKAHLIATCKAQSLPIIVCGGAGGVTDPTCIDIHDLALVHHDPLIKQVRSKLRKDYNFPKGKDQKTVKFGIDCVFSTERPVFPTRDGRTSPEQKLQQDRRLSCDSGFGSVTHITASVGLFAAARCLKNLSN